MARGRARLGAIALLTLVWLGAGGITATPPPPSGHPSGHASGHPDTAAVSLFRSVLPGLAPADAATEPAPSRPVVLTTDAELARARERARDPRSPFHGSWQAVKRQADAALERRFRPAEPDLVSAYYELANPEARAVHALAVAYRVTDDPAYLRRARKALMAWATMSNADLPPDRTSPSWRDHQYPGKAMPDAAGLHLSRVLVVFADAYAMLQPSIPAAERREIERWFASMRSPIQRSTQLWQTQPGHSVAPNRIQPTPAPWMDRQLYSNHLTAHTMGLLAIGYVTRNGKLVSHALDHPDNPRDLRALFDGVLLMPGDALHHRDPTLSGPRSRWPEPLPGEIYDRYRVLGRTGTGDKGFIYTSLGQRFLTIATEIAANNDAPVNYWRAAGRNGENLRDSYATYGPFISEPDEAAACRGRYHEASANGPQMEARWRAMTELAFREYPHDPAIRRVVRTAAARNYNDTETFGPSAPLLKGEALDVTGGPNLRFRDPATGVSTTQLPAAAGADAHFLGDWNGNGIDTPGWRVGNVYHLSNRPDGTGAKVHRLGRSCDDPIVGDWNGDGRDSIGVRQGTRFHLAPRPGDRASITYTMGRASDRVVIGDWNGNGIDTPALVRGNRVFLRASNAEQATTTAFDFARASDRFLAGDWNGDGTDTLAAVRQSGDRLTWHLRAGNAPGSDVATRVTHGTRHDGVLSGRPAGGRADLPVTVQYRD